MASGAPARARAVKKAAPAAPAARKSNRPASLTRLGSGEGPNLHTVNFCLYSFPGEGKTAFWGSGNERVLILDSDPGLGTQTCETLGMTPLVAPVIDYDDLETMYQWCKNDMPKEEPDVKWVAWDSLTLFQDATLIDEIMPDAVAENPKQEEFVPSRREYLMNMNRIGRYVRQFVNLPVNFGVSCHAEFEVVNGENMLMPQVQGKNMPQKVAGYMNVVGFMAKAKVPSASDPKKSVTVQRILFQQEGKFFAKDRFNALGHHMDKPSLPKVDEAIAAKRAAMIKGTGSPAPTRRPVRRQVSKAAASASTK